MDNASQKQANSTTVKSTISCALQVSWIPVVCYAQHVEWSGLPIECALPLACYFAAVLFAVACVMHFIREALKSDSNHVLDIGAIATYAFGIALLLATGQSEGSAPISCVAFALIGCSSGIGVLQLERCLMCLEPKRRPSQRSQPFSSPAPPFWFCRFFRRQSPLSHPSSSLQRLALRGLAWNAPKSTLRPSIQSSFAQKLTRSTSERRRRCSFLGQLRPCPFRCSSRAMRHSSAIPPKSQPWSTPGRPLHSCFSQASS